MLLLPNWVFGSIMLSCKLWLVRLHVIWGLGCNVFWICIFYPIGCWICNFVKWLVAGESLYKAWLMICFLLHIKCLFKCFLGHNEPNPCLAFWDRAKSLFCSAISFYFLFFLSEVFVVLQWIYYWFSSFHLFKA